MKEDDMTQLTFLKGFLVAVMKGLNGMLKLTVNLR